jgi:hypothetical protein
MGGGSHPFKVKYGHRHNVTITATRIFMFVAARTLKTLVGKSFFSGLLLLPDTTDSGHIKSRKNRAAKARFLFAS